MIKYENTNTFVTGTFPDTVANNSTGAATPDGFEFIKAYLDNSNLGPMQSIMDYASGSANAPTGSVGVPNGVTEAAGVSQIVEALHKMTGSGPGTMKPWAKEDDPSVTGDRVLLLAEQGVLIASFPDLDAATWIGGDTSAQIAAIAAGKKFYRSSDAGGATGNAAGPYLQLPPNLQPTFLKQYLGGGVDFTVSGSSTWTTTREVAIPYQTSDGTWRMMFNFRGTFAAATSINLTISGVQIKAVANFNQSLSVSQNSSGSVYNIKGHYLQPSGFIQLLWSGNIASANVSGDVELASKPTWADDFEIQWGITY